MRGTKAPPVQKLHRSLKVLPFLQTPKLPEVCELCQVFMLFVSFPSFLSFLVINLQQIFKISSRSSCRSAVFLFPLKEVKYFCRLIIIK